MDENRRRFVPSGVDLVLFAMAVVLVGTGELLLRMSPTWWGYYLSAMDARVWPPWKCLGSVMLVLISLLVIRRWPTGTARRNG